MLHICKYVILTRLYIKNDNLKINYFKNKIIMKTIKNMKRFLPGFILLIITVILLNPLLANASSNSDKVIYPLKQVSKLECRFTEFDKLSTNCKQDLPILNTKDYKKYATQNWGYNDYTRLYTVLWGASYKYGWDVWHWGHLWTDIATSKWTPVYSIANWKVILAKFDNMEWNMISIEHHIRWKYVVSNYFHLSALYVKKWDIISVWKQIWKVWSTWNSTWNHLHFQIDLDTPYHPYYYDYNKCPYSYYKITETGICFDEMAKNTLDPLLFLETKWYILDKLSTTKTYTTIDINSSNNSTENELSIFNRTVYIWYWKSDIKKVQEIFKKMWYYNWIISWNYKDIEASIIAYQLSKKIISSKNDDWAGRFGPKTRYAAKKDYLSWSKNTTTKLAEKGISKSTIKTQKISRNNLMSREEIEKMEVDDFLKNYNIDLYFPNHGSNIKKNSTEILKLKITNKKWKVFKWEMPWWMTFIVNTEKINVFPKKLFYFTDWKRDIRLTWIDEWNTNLYIKIWKVTIKTIQLKVYNWNTTIYPDSAQIISSNNLTLWAKKTWVILFKDKSDKNLINLPYWSTYNLKVSGGNKICIKRWNIKDVKNIYRSNCNDADYKNEYNFSYNDTVWWLLIYDFKANSKDFNITLKNNYDNKQLSNKKIAVSNPKWLNKAYVYTNEVMNMLQKWIVNWIKSWYFLEKRDLQQKDAFVWIKNALLSMQNNSNNNETTNKINNNLAEIEKAIKYSSKYKTITRQDYLNITYKYLVFDKNNSSEISYRDIDKETSNKLSNIFDNNTTWKDKFGKNYFRPDKKITRWEWAYFLAQSLDKISHSYLTLR